MGFMKRAMVSAAVAGVALALLLLPASAADTPDQQVAITPPEGVTNWNAMEGVNAVDILRQTFTPAQASLTKVEIYLAPDGVPKTTGDVFVTLQVKKVGTGTVVATEIVKVPDQFTGGWVTFDFPTATVDVGQQYAIEASVDNDTKKLAWGYSNSAAYAGGTGATVTAGPLLYPKAYDFLFKTYYESGEACGQLLFGSKPPAAGGFGTFAINCGDVADLVTVSGCPAATSAFFYNKADGGFAVYLPGATVVVVNAEFLGIFNGDPDIEEPTIFTAKCK